MDVLDYVTVGAALLGAALGIVNTIWALWRDRVRLKVVPLWLSNVLTEGGAVVGTVSTEYPDGFERRPDGALGLRVINSGLIEVTVDGVGLTPSGWWHRMRRSTLIRRTMSHDAFGAVQLPRRLAPRESVTLWASPGGHMEGALRGAKRVYASTACGLDIFATSALLRRAIRWAESRTG